MSAAAVSLDHLRARHASLTLAGTDRWSPLRALGLEHFMARGFPTLRDEDWRYTSMRAIERKAFEVAAHAAVSAGQIDDIALFSTDVTRLVFVNGHFDPALSSATAAAPFARNLGSLCSVDSAGSGDEQASLAAGLGSIASLETHPFAALNTAFFQDGACIELPAGHSSDTPIYILHLCTAEEGERMALPRLWLNAGRGAQATVIEHFASLGGGVLFNNALGEIQLGDGAQIEHYRIQDDDAAAQHISGLHVRQARDSHLRSHNFDLGARLARHDLHCRLEENGAAIVMNGLFVGADNRHVDNHTRVDHIAPHTNSEQDYRGVMAGRSRGVFNGKVVVHKGAIRIDAQQSSRNLLLSAGAEIDTKPELEIYADDVKCSHGATIGRLDEDALFYLRTRGIDAETARSLLVFAFADDVMARIGIPALRQRLELAVLDRLPQADDIRGFL